MSNGQKLLIIPNDLRDAAGLFDHRSGEFESIAEILRREWRALEVPSEYAGEAAVAAACERAFGELLRSRQICVEVARALRLTADTLEEADRRAAALIRCERGNGGGGSGDMRLYPQPVPPPWLPPIGEWLWNVKDELSTVTEWAKLDLAWRAIGYPGALRWVNEMVDLGNGRKIPVPRLNFAPHIGLPRDFDISTWPNNPNWISDPKRFIRDFDPNLSSLAGRPGRFLDFIDRHLPWINPMLAIAKDGQNPHQLLFVGDILLARKSPSLVGVFAKAYEALTDSKYADRREAALLVKVGTEVATTAIVTGVLTVICPVGAPLWAVVGATVAKFAAPIVVDHVMQNVKVGDHSIEDFLINKLDTWIDTGKSELEQASQRFTNNLNTATAKVVEGIHQAAQSAEQVKHEALDRFNQLFNLSGK